MTVSPTSTGAQTATLTVTRVLYFPSHAKLDAGDFGQDVNTYWSNSNLIDNLFFGEGCSRDSIMLKGGAEFLEMEQFYGKGENAPARLTLQGRTRYACNFRSPAFATMTAIRQITA